MESQNRECYVCLEDESERSNSDKLYNNYSDGTYRCKKCTRDFEIFDQVVEIISKHTPVNGELYNDLHVYFTGVRYPKLED